MKSIHSVFEDEEYKKIKKRKEELKLSWHDFILLLVNIKVSEEKIKKIKKEKPNSNFISKS